MIGDESRKHIGKNRLLDARAVDVETVHTAPIHEVLAGAVITRRRVPAAIANVQAATAVSTGSQPCNSADPSLTAPPAWCGFGLVLEQAAPDS